MALSGPSAAAASTYSQVLKAYQVHGSVPACEFTPPQLERALKAIDTYGAQYFQDFATAIQNALSARASGGCAPNTAQSAQAPGGAGTGGGGGPPIRLGPVTTGTHSTPPAPLLLLAALLILVGAIGSLALVARWRGWSPGWAASWSHAWGEAGFRSEGRWLEFTDWLRSGGREP